MRALANNTAPNTKDSAGLLTGLGAGVALLVLYGVTLARGVTYWDAGEFLSAIHSLGIPHPPGTPIFVLMARVWSDLLAPLLGFTIAVNAFSAVCTAAAGGILANLMYRWTRDSAGAWAAAVCAGATSSIWLNATETEVYSCALFAACVMLWVANEASETNELRWITLAAYLCGIAWALHLTVLLIVPAGLVFAIPVLVKAYQDPARRGTRWKFTVQFFGTSLLLAAFGASAVLYMLIRAQHDPVINQGNPSTWRALWDAVERHQYNVAPLWPRRAPAWLQLANVFEYADWQFALGLHSDPGPSWTRTPITVLFALAGLWGCIVHRRVDRRSWWALMVLFITGTLGVVTYLNLRAGPSFGYGFIPDTALREARERDYFFTFGFLCWGLWAGYGCVTFARQYSHSRRWGWIGAAIACVPIICNWAEIRTERHDEQQAAVRTGVKFLNSVPANGVFFADGDNDTYPLWYLQEVHGFRRDVIIVTIPLLGASWYRQELVRRHALLDPRLATTWFGVAATTADIRRHAIAQHRPIVTYRSP